jgi:23S rRNA (uridine2552-2'-O)-methyltransferase
MMNNFVVSRCSAAMGSPCLQHQTRLLSKKRKASSRQWLDRHMNDPFVKKAQDTGKVSRSYYKLEFLDKKCGIFHAERARVIDLGAAPGGWTTYASEKKGVQVLAIDLLEMDSKIACLPNVEFVQGDFTKLVDELSAIKVHVVMSDMAPNFMGDSRIDAVRTADLCEHALEFSFTVLEPGGVFIGKFFSGPEEQELKAMALQEFTKVVTVKPPASRNESAERYLVAQDRR